MRRELPHIETADEFGHDEKISGQFPMTLEQMEHLLTWLGDGLGHGEGSEDMWHQIWATKATIRHLWELHQKRGSG